MMRRFSDEIDRLFSGTWRQGEGETLSNWYPQMEVTKTNGTLVLCVDLPGTKPQDVKVEVSDDAVIIRGERKHEREDKDEGYYRSERRYGSFYRSIPLPEGAETDKAKAEFTNGELKISIPVPEAKSTRREIPVKAG